LRFNGIISTNRLYHATENLNFVKNVYFGLAVEYNWWMVDYADVTRCV